MQSPTLETTRKTLADEWNRRSPSTVEEIAAFYRESECLGRDLDAWHETPERAEWTRFLVDVARNHGVVSVLDVGAGGGHDILALANERPGHYEVTAVEPNDALRARIGGAVADISEVTGEFDLAICIDVLEHVPDPEELVAAVADRVRLGGLLIEATATHDQGTPLHLAELAGWHPGPVLRELGFREVNRLNRLTVWQKYETAIEPGTILLCAHREVTVPTVECLFELVGRGWPIAMVYGDALIDRARSKAASAWYRNESEDVFLMIDDDIVFRPEDAERVVQLAREKRSIACGAYPVGDGSHMASRGWPGQRLEFGADKEPVEIRWPATGFMAVHRDVIGAMSKIMPECYSGTPGAFWPMFQPFPLSDVIEGAEDYLSEDYAFGQRALALGFPTYLDPKSILIHLKVKGLSVFNMSGATVERKK